MVNHSREAGLKHWVLGLCLALLVQSDAIVAVSADDELPDLKVEFVSLPIPSGSRDVQIRITNISDWWADETSARVETTAPQAGNVVTGIKIENLDPGQSTLVKYTLAAGCNGHKVKVVVAAAKNYAGLPETATGNNQDEKIVCSASGQPEPKPFDPDSAAVVVRPSDRISDIIKSTELDEDVLAQPPINIGAEETLTLRPAVLKSVVQHRGIGGIGADSFRSQLENETPVVGWAQDEGGALTRDWVSEAQTAVYFDLAPLDRVERKVINTAFLAFDEAGVLWTSGSGQEEFKPRGCVEVLALATDDWLGSGGVAAFVPSAFYDDAPMPIPNTRTRQWNVKGHVLSQTQDPGDQSLRHGYVLKGGMQLNALQGQDETKCMSAVQNIRLVVSFARLSN
jgi:hypothetical protein